MQVGQNSFLLLHFSSAAAYNNGTRTTKNHKSYGNKCYPNSVVFFENVEYEFKFQLKQHQLLYMQLSIPSMFQHLTHPFFIF